MRVVDIVAPFAPVGAGTRGKFVLLSPRGEMGASTSGTPRESQANFRVGTVWYCRRVLWKPGPRSQYSETIRFIEKHGIQEEGGRNVAQYSLTPGKPTPKSNFRDRT